MKKTTLLLIFLAAMLNSSSTVKISEIWKISEISRSALPRPNRDYALFFAVNDYQPGSGFDDLSKPIENAEAIAKELRDRYGFWTEVVKNPTLDQISAKLEAYKTFFAKNPQGKYPSTGQLLIYFTGHGISENNNGYFVPADGNSKKLYSTAFAYEIWRPFINNIDCRHILVAIDACFSVTFDPDWYSKKMNPGDFKRPGELSEGDKLLLANEADKCRILFTSDGQEDKVPERSNFARKFLDGLQNGPRQDGILTSEGLAGYLRFAAPIPRLTEFGSDEKGSFVFVQTVSKTSEVSKTTDVSAELARDLAAWKTAKTANTVAALQKYLTDFPNGEFREQASAAIRVIEQDLAIRRDDLAWEVTTEKNTVAAYKKYQADYPSGRHYTEATLKIKSLETAATNEGMVLVQGGNFTMGSPASETGRSENETQHSVTLSSFYMGKHEVTIGEYLAFCDETKKNYPEWLEAGNQYNIVTGTNDYYKQKGMSRDNKTHPVTGVSWNDATAYCEWLSRKTGKKYRLPTEAEWEYAARGGQAGARDGFLYAGSNNIDEVAWYTSNSGSKTHPVGGKKANQLGLFDMTGNVWEWCSDWYGAYPTAAQTDPKGPTTGGLRVFRGGSWGDYADYCRAAYRYRLEPANRHNGVGFRLVLQ